MFSLAKWYLDVVADDGTVVVGYSARLVWGGARVAYASTLVSPAGAPAQEESAFGDAGALRHEERDLRWHHRALSVRGAWHRLAPPIEQRLLHAPGGDITWRCVMPRARVELDIGPKRVTGLGYAELLTLTLPPWQLPFNRLQWGRFTSAASSVIWIAWFGDDARQFVWQDGVPQPGAELDEHGLRHLVGGARLDFGQSRDICARPAVARLIDRLPVPMRRVAGPLAAMNEHKMVSASRLVTPDGSAETGWSVFEEVQW